MHMGIAVIKCTSVAQRCAPDCWAPHGQFETIKHEGPLNAISWGWGWAVTYSSGPNIGFEKIKKIV